MTETHVENVDPFSIIPEALLYDPAICAEAVRVYGVLRRHGDDPSNCYPGHARIAALIGKSARSVPGWIRQLEAAGWVDRIARTTVSGDPDSNGYRVHMRAVERGVRAGGRRPSAASSAEGSAPNSAPKESHGEREPENELVLVSVEGSVEAVTVAFERFWTDYPNKRGKRAALTAFERATKRAPVGRVLDGCARYAADPNLPEPQFVPHAATWLNGDRWDDPPLPERAKPKGKPVRQQWGEEGRDQPTGKVAW